jgi:hypothetical protein
MFMGGKIVAIDPGCVLMSWGILCDGWDVRDCFVSLGVFTSTSMHCSFLVISVENP